MTNVAIVILNWNQPKITVDTINSLLKIEHRNFHYSIYLIDNHSSDESYPLFCQTFRKNKLIKIFQTKSNLGYVGGNNFGIKKALKKKYDYILIANNDILVDKFFLQELVNFSQSRPNIAVLGPKIFFAKGFEYHKDRYSEKDKGKVIWSMGGKIDWQNIIGSNLNIDEVDRGQFTNPITEIDFISGCCFLIKTSVLKKAGPFDNKFFMYLEDADLSQRIKKIGYQIALVPSSKIWHLNATSSKPGSDLHNYFLTRNRLLFGFRYASLRTKFALLRESFRILIFSPSKWQKIGVLDFYLQKFDKGSWQ